MLSVRDIETFYGRMVVLRRVSLEIQRSEAVCVIGPNGAGKTTLLHSVAGITPIKKGSVFLENEKIHRMLPMRIVRKGISLVPEGRRVFGPLTVLENLMMGAYVRRRRDDAEEIERDLKNMFELLPVLGERQDQLAGELSGGEQQMLALARALMSRPKLLMLDEPSMGLAPLVVKEIFNVLERLKREKTTLLLVEQNARIALKLSDRGYVLERGRIVTQGLAEELLEDEAIKRAYLGK